MSKFNNLGAKPATGRSPVQTDAVSSGRTHQGGPGFGRDEKSELFLLGVSNMVGEKTFYEQASARDSRYAELISFVGLMDPTWVADFLRWLRSEMNMRSAALVGAAEFVQAYTSRGLLPGENPMETDPRGPLRRAVDAVLQRADEPGEILAYWTSKYGRRIPKPMKRGVADAVRRLYTERNLLKYDTASHGFRFADVLELVHPQPALDRAAWQGPLFQYAIDQRHGRGDAPETLAMISANLRLRKIAAENPDILLHSDALTAAGMTWEDALSLAGDRVSKKALWTAMVPSMGYMALLRNLRNFDQAGVSPGVVGWVSSKLADVDEVNRSRQLPMRFLSAYRATQNLAWHYPLEQALTHSIHNIPELSGRTLILVDTSGSMNEGFSKDGTLKRWDAAAIFGIALGKRCEQKNVVSFSDYHPYYNPGAKSKAFPMPIGESLLLAIKRWQTDKYFIGAGTDTASAVREHYKGHDRVVVLTDEQAGYGRMNGVFEGVVPDHVPTYTWNLAGYEKGHAAGKPNRHTFGGLTDAAFRLIPLLEAGRDQSWPWMTPSRIDAELKSGGVKRERPSRKLDSGPW